MNRRFTQMNTETRKILHPAMKKKRAATIIEHPAFGMWKDRQDLTRPEEFVRRLRVRIAFGKAKPWKNSLETVDYMRGFYSNISMSYFPG